MGISKPIRLATITVAVEKYSQKTVENAGRKRKVKNIISSHEATATITVCAFDERCLYDDNGTFKSEYRARLNKALHLSTESEKNSARIKNIVLADHIISWSMPYHPDPDQDVEAQVCWHRMLPDSNEPEETIAWDVTQEGTKQSPVKLNWISAPDLREQIEQPFLFKGFNYIMLINNRSDHIGFNTEEDMITYLVDNNVDKHEIIRINFEQVKMF